MSRTVIIGGGAIGLSLAWHLCARDAGEVILLERNRLTSGTSWHAAGIVGPLRATPGMTRIAAAALETFPRLEAETGMATGYRRTGGYWLARVPERLDELRRIADLGATQGLTPAMLGPAAIGLPLIDTTGLVGALQVPEDANVNPVDLCMAYARAARNLGADIREGAAVARITRAGDRVTGVALADGTRIAADHVAICTGAWSRDLAAAAGLALPLQPVAHMYIVTEPFPGLPDPMPVLRDLDRGIYVKGDAGKLVIGGFEPNAKCWDPHGPEGDRPFLEMAEDWDQFGPFLQAALDLFPALDSVGIQHFMNGPESFTADTRPLVGAAPRVDGLYVAAGMNSVGVMSSAGIGRALADWIADGEPPRDLWEIDVARADPAIAAPPHMAARMEEAVADLFALHWPYRQPKAGRGLRVSPLHDRWAAAGAVFGLTAGWERGLWYARDDAERTLPYATGAQPWWPIARREAAVLATGTVLLDLTPFTKIDITADACAMNRITTAQLDVPPGRAVYTQMLNPRGGIELDVTVTRLDADRFHVTSGAATRQRDLAWLRRNLPGATLDVTEEFCTIGVMGATAATTLGAVLGHGDWAGAALGAVRSVPIAGTTLRATRMSFVGTEGWELMVPNAAAPALFDALIAAGARPMGHYALDGCRVEVGFRHWGHDIGPDITPLEAGLGFTIDWAKDFQGKDALAAQRDAGLTRRLALLTVEGAPLLLHDEPVFEGGRFVGLTTSGVRGPRTGLDLAFALVDIGPGETPADTAERAFTVRVAGTDYPANALARPPLVTAARQVRP